MTDAAWTAGRRVAAVIATLLIAGASLQQSTLRLVSQDRAVMRAELGNLRYRRVPHLREVLDEGARRTKPRDVVALVTPVSGWKSGYEYCYVGAAYVLAGRDVQPLLGPGDVSRRDVLTRADAIVSVYASPSIPGFRPVWTSRYGAVLERER